MNTPITPFVVPGFDSSGSGHIFASQNFSKPCQWNYSQRSDGKIEVHCRLTPNDLNALRDEARKFDESAEDAWFEERGLQFEGRTSGGMELRLKTVNFVVSPEEGELVFHVAQAQWVKTTKVRASSEAQLSHIAFRLVNHEIQAVPPSSATLPSGLNIKGTLVPLRLPSGNAWLRAVEDHYEVIRQLEKKGGVAVTTEFLLPIASYEQEDESVEIARRLCCVLTLLFGNRVNWISYSVFAADGSVVSGSAHDAVTRSYQKTNLLNTLSDRDVALRLMGTSYAPIIDRMMERFESQHERWNLTSIINSFHEAISSGHFLEQQGQLLSNCMEMLRQSFLNHGGNEFVLPAADFEAQEKGLLKSVKQVLEQHFPAQDNWTPEQCKEHRAKLSQMATHIKGSNRYGFKRTLTDIAGELELLPQLAYEKVQPIDARGFIAPRHLDPKCEEIEAAQSDDAPASLKASHTAFVNIRDHLTHQGRFLVPQIDESVGWTSEKVNKERMKQERFMERFVAAHLATILGWHQPLPTAPPLYQSS